MFDISDFEPDEPIYTVSTACDRIIEIVNEWAVYCPKSFGWGFPDLRDLLSEELMQRHLEMAFSQKRWIERLGNDQSEGELLLAWVNLGFLAEGALKILACVYNEQWIEDDDVPTQYGKKPDSNKTMLDKLILFSRKKSFFGEDIMQSLLHIQVQRNLIHPLKTGTVDNRDNLYSHIVAMAHMHDRVDRRMPPATFSIS